MYNICFTNTKVFNLQGFAVKIDYTYNAMGLMRIAALFCAKNFK